MTFKADLSRFAEKTGLAGDVIIRKIGLDVFRKVVQKSPVDTGRFRGSWQIGINRVDPSVIGGGKEGFDLTEQAGPVKTTTGAPITGEETTRALSRLATAKLGDTIYVSNNLPYARPLENGHSKQAPGPNAILGRTVAEIESEIRNLVEAG